MKVKADFSEVSEQAKKLADQFSLSMKNASEAGAQSVFGSYSKSYKKIGALQANLERERGNLERQRAAREVKEAELKVKNDLKAARGELSHAKFVEKIQTENALKVAAIRAESDKDTRNALKAEIRANQELLFLSHQSVSSAKKLNDEIREVSLSIEGIDRAIEGVGHTIAHIEKDSEKVAENLKEASDRAESAAKEIHDFFKDLGDASKFGDKIEGVGEKIGEAFKDGIDVQALSQDLGKGVGKVLSTVGKSLGGNAGVMVGALGGVVAMVGLLLAAFIGFDKKIKEFNKDIIKTHGALSTMRLGAGNLTEGLRIMKDAVSDLSGNFGVSEEDAKSLFASMDNGGQTLSRLSRATFQGQTAQAALSASLRDTYTAANMTGESLSTYADNLTNYVNDLGMSTQTVNDNFRSIAKMASESAFGTRRFYSMVVQATAGQSALNVSMDQTGDLLLRMSKIMGAKKAAEMVGGAASDMGGMSATERIKTLLIAGGRGNRVFNREARSQAGGFSTAHSGAADQSAIQSAAAAGLGEELGATVAEAIKRGEANPDALVRTLGKLGIEQQQKLLSSLRNTGATAEERATNTETARQLDQLILVTRGARGSRSDRVAAMGGLSAGGSMAMRAAQMRRFMNPEGRVSEVNRAAAESVSGMSGHQMDSFLSLMQANAGDMNQLRTLTEKQFTTHDLTPAETQILKQLQETHHVQAESGRVVDASHREITTSDELLQTNPARTAEAIAKTRTEAETIAVQTMDATVSITDILENRIARIMQNVYDVLNGPINAALTFVVDHFPGLNGGGNAAQRMKTQHTALGLIDEKLAGGAAARSKRVRDIAAARVTSTSSDASDADKTAAKELLKQLEAARRQDQQMVDVLTMMRASIASGNTFYTRDQGGRGDNGRAQLYDALDGNHLTQGIQIDPNLPTPTPGATPTPSVPGAAPAATPNTAAPTVAPTPAPPVPAHAEVAAAPVVEQGQDAQAQDQQHHVQTRRDARQRDQRAQAFNEKLLKGKDLGDGLAMSKLPDAIAEADAKMRLTEALFKGGKSADEVTRILAGRNLTEADTGNADYGGMIRSRQSRVNPGVHDFISQNRGGQTVITPIDRADQVTGQKPGGPIAAAGRGGGGNVNISINGGDERRVFDVVRRAIQQAGITPNRVPGA